MAKKNNNNSDWMSRKQDEQTEQLEERLTALYANAENEIRAKWDDFMSGFEKEDTARRKLVESGSMPEDEYTAWRKTQILKSNQYSKAVESMSNMLVETDVAAMATVNEELPQVVAESYDFVQGLGFQAAEEAGLTSGTFQIYNARTVQALIKDNPDLMPKPAVDIPEDQRWSKERINREITQGIVQGESIPKIANRLSRVTTMDRNAAVRNARTAMTGAENLGRYQSAQDLRENGIPIEEVWMATPDDRTRESHRLLDGTTRDESGYFGVGIIDTPLRFAGDPLGAPEEVYNCRCRTGIVLQGIDHSQDGDLYAEFMRQFEDGKELIGEKEPEPEAQSQHPEPEQKTAKEIAEAQAEEFSRAEKTEIMEYYVSEEGFAMNAYARGDSLEPWKDMDFTEKDIAEYTDKLTQILENERLEEATQVYRGASFDTIIQSTGLTEEQIREDPQLLIGQTITEHGFMSTTSQYSMAEEYAGGDVVMRIDLPEGAKAIDENKYLEYLDGKEVTVQRECEMKINMAYETEDENGRTIIIVQAEYVDAGPDREAPEQIATSRIEDMPAAKDLETAEEQKETQEEKAPEVETFETKTFNNPREATEYFRGTTYDSNFGTMGKRQGFGLREEDNKPATKWQNKLTYDQTVAVTDYTGNSYEPVNNFLRGIWDKKEAADMMTGNYTVNKEIKLLDGAIKKYDLKEPITVHRTCEREFVDQLEIGSTFHDGGYGSTSVIDTPVASGDVHFEIDVPAGKGVGAYVDGLSWKEGEEFEFLLARGADYYITEKEIRKDGIYIKAVVTGFSPKQI